MNVSDIAHTLATGTMSDPTTHTVLHGISDPRLGSIGGVPVVIKTGYRAGDTGRELAALALSAAMPGLVRIPETVARTLPHYGDSLVVRFLTDAREGNSRYAGVPRSDLVGSLLFDYLTANVDRHGGNTLVNRADGRLYLIDHGFCFPQQRQTVSYTDPASYARLSGRAYPAYIRSYLTDRLIPSYPTLLPTLTGLVGQTATERMVERADALLQSGRFPR